ncbi:MAG: hypothetical protein Q7S09_04685 [bacterium]|nr:hypothetical protein [bacterium]
MIIVVFFLVAFLAILSWNAVILWYLKKYIVEDDRVHHSMIAVFTGGNAVFVAVIILLFLRVSWNDAASSIADDLTVQLNNIFR